VGYEEGGQLSERVRRKPYSVVLLDEIEKAHPDIFNILLQILEEGRMTDSYGRKIDFRNTVLIMTSNVGVDLLKKKGSLGFTKVEEEIPYDRMKESLTEEVKKTFKPEFLNRLDDIVVFKPLSKESLVGILDNEVAYVNIRLKEQMLSCVLDEDVKAFFLEKGFDPVYGARPVKRAIQKYLEDPLSEELIMGTFKERVAAANGATVSLTVKMKDKESVMFV
jgi:ATP-dependent Clp protease ATP-binding subunit ClpC